MKDYSAIAERYCRDVISGEIPACKWVKLACQRHLDDLDWQSDEGFRYRYDRGRAHKACAFIELMPHTKGKWAADRQHIVLEPWQAFMTCALFGWMRKHDNTRRYRRFFLLVPRKNGKSAWAAAVGNYMLAADGEYGAEVYSGATSEKQAWEVFRPAKLMASKRPDMCAHYGVTVNASNMHILSSGSRFEPIIGKPGDGASPSCAIVDEYHEHQTDHMFDTMETGMGARDQPVMLVITTAGDNIAGPCYQLQHDAQQMMEGSRSDDETFALIYGIDGDDDPFDPASLEKANPNIGVSVGREYLLTRQRDAMSSPRKAGVFKTKHLNVWVQARDAYFNVVQFQKCADPGLSIDQFEDQECVIGIDLAEKKDLTAVEILFRHKGGYARFGKYYLPEDTVELPENEHFRRWRDDGQLIQTDGAVTDEREIYNDILEMCDRFRVREVAFDPHHSRQMSVLLMEQGVQCIDFGNRPLLMNEPMRAMDALIADGKLYHDGGQAFEWMLSNVVQRSRNSDLHSPAKQRPENKIDGPVACMMALGRWLVDEVDGPSVYEERGILTV